MLVLSKDEGSKNVKFNYVDSLNLEVFNLISEEQIQKFVEERDQDKKKHGKTPFTPFLKQIFGQWIKDINTIVRIIYRVIKVNYIDYL